MKKRIFAILLLAALMLSLLAACGEKASVITGDLAQKIAAEAAGLADLSNADIHTHIGEQDGIPCFNVHITVGEKEYSFAISATDGKIIASGDEIGH